jgi:hypothetical protein
MAERANETIAKLSKKEVPVANGLATSGSAASDGAPSVEGSKWQFPYSAITKTTSTLEFLPAGRIRSNGGFIRGFWKQNGKQLTVNQNDYTLLKMTIDGDTMYGEGEYLKGPSIGMKFSPSLTRVAEGGVEGTKWRFPYSPITKATSTLEFLAGGRLRVDGKLIQGGWKQEGAQITIDQNDFTLFKLTVDGDAMRGTWERLHGDDAGRKNPSSLTRVRD